MRGEGSSERQTDGRRRASRIGMAGAFVLGLATLIFVPSLALFGPGVFVGANFASRGLDDPTAAWGALGLAVASATYLAGFALGVIDLFRGADDFLGSCLIPALNALGALAFALVFLALLTVAG